MPESRADRLMAIFLGAAELPDAERPKYLDRECAGDPSLRAEVESLLSAGDRAGDFLADPTIVSHAGPATEAHEDLKELGRIGPYRLLSILGEGGFGVVYLAERREPHVQRVALKVIKPGMDSRAVLARFEQERQALAMMSHPNVARVFDAGTTSDGRPYFVMEHVQGEPITHYCDRNRFTIGDRLRLFVSVCEAVQHAHHKGIIHRDIKPSNVLVESASEQGGSAGAIPKVIDFGVAKAISHTLTDKTIFTEHGQIIGTPEYMSPEQAEVGATDIDTRTDVYSLGVLLYELLTGVLPFDPRELRSKGFAEIQRIIREVDPPRPSTRISDARGPVNELAESRQVRTEELSRQLRSELEWVPLKAMRKNRAERYRTPSDLADDVRNYLAGRALSAGPESRRYRFRKFLRRHRAPLAAACAVAAMLVLGLIGTSWGFYRASVDREHANRARIDAETARRSEADQRRSAERSRDEASRQSYIANVAAAEASIRINEVGAARRRLEAAPDSLRNWEWKYLTSRTDQSLRVMTGHRDLVSWVGFAPDGTHPMTGAWDGLREWNDTGARRFFSGTFNQVVVAVSHQASRTIMLVKHGMEFAVVDAATNEPVFKIPGRGDLSIRGDFSSDGKLLAFIHQVSTHVTLFDTVAGTEVRRFDLQTGSPACARISPDGTLVAAGGTNGRDKSQREAQLFLWELSTAKEQAVFTGAPGTTFTNVAFSPDGARVAAGDSEGFIRVWNISARKQTVEVRAHSGPITALVFSPDGSRLASGALDPSVKLLEAATGTEIRTLRGHTGGIESLAFSPDGTRLLSGGSNEEARLWDATATGDAITFAPPPNLRSGFGSFALSPDGSRIAIARIMEIWIYDTSTERQLARLLSPTAAFMSIAFSPDGTLLASGDQHGKVRLWNMADGSVTATRPMHRTFVHKVAFTPDGRQIISLASDGQVRFWNWRSDEPPKTFQTDLQSGGPLAISPDGRCMAAGGNVMKLRSWRLSDGAPLFGENLTGRFVTSLAYSPDSSLLAAATSDGMIRLLDASTGEERGMMTTGSAWAAAIGFNPDGTRLVVGGNDRAIRFWDVATRSEVAAFPVEGSGVRQLGFDFAGVRLAATTADGTTRLLDCSPESVRRSRRLDGQAANSASLEHVTAAVQAADGDWLAAAQRLKADNALTPEVRSQGLAEVLRRASEDRNAHWEETKDLLRPYYQRLILGELVVAELEADHTLDAGTRRRAIQGAKLMKDDAMRLSGTAWEAVKLPGASVETCERALIAAQEAYFQVQVPGYLTAVGVAQFRLNRFNEALKTLSESDAVNRRNFGTSTPSDCVFLALTHFHLGNLAEAAKQLDSARTLAKSPRFQRDADLPAIIAEAEAIIGKPQ